MACGLDDLYRDVKELVDSDEPFRPSPYYSPEGDTLFLYTRDVPSYSKRLNSVLTLVLTQNDDSLVGCKIKGVSRILRCAERLGKSIGFGLVDGKIKLRIFIEFALVAPPEEPDLSPYEDQLYEAFADFDVDTRELTPAG